MYMHMYMHMYVYIYIYIYISLSLSLSFSPRAVCATHRLWPQMARAALIEDRATVSAGENPKFAERTKNPPVANFDSMVNMKGMGQGPNRAI